MYKIIIGRGKNALTQYYLTYSEARAASRSLGYPSSRIKPVH